MRWMNRCLTYTLSAHGTHSLTRCPSLEGNEKEGGGCVNERSDTALALETAIVCLSPHFISSLS